MVDPGTPPHPRSPTPLKIGAGLIGEYTKAPDGTLRFEGSRPGPGWHRHDWPARTLTMVDDLGVRQVEVQRRRWLQYGTTTTRVDRTPDEVGRIGATLLVVLLKLATWLRAEVGLLRSIELVATLEHACSSRTVQRWLRRLVPDATWLQSTLRTAAVERSEPQPLERLFPGGLSPPEAIRRRRWKEPEATYRLATGLAFLVDGAMALSTSTTVLLAEAQRDPHGHRSTPRI